VKSVVLVHSGFVDGSGWEGVYDVLKKDGYDVLRWTTRKHGVASERCEQRCWVHEAANVLAKLPKSQQPKAKRALQEIWMAEHWKHLRTTNPIESTFATVRHRTIRSKGCLRLLICWHDAAIARAITPSIRAIISAMAL
jgi:hypothetical protein